MISFANNWYLANLICLLYNLSKALAEVICSKKSSKMHVDRKNQMTPEIFRREKYQNFRRSRRNGNFWGIFKEFRKNYNVKSSQLPLFFYILRSLQTFFSQSDNFQIEVSIHFFCHHERQFFLLSSRSFRKFGKL